jgi:membrane fusion protein
VNSPVPPTPPPATPPTPPTATRGRNLFRPESLQALQPRLQGEVILTPSMSVWWWCLLALLVTAALVAFVSLGSYTRRSAVAGHLVPTAGMIRVQTPQAGVVLERKVVEGQVVHKGDVLFVLGSDRVGVDTRDVQLDIRREIEARRRSLEDEMARNQKSQNDELAQVNRRTATLQTEAQTIQRQIEQQRRRVAIAEDARKRYQGLADQDYIAREQLVQKEIELSEQQSRLQILERDALAVQRELSTAQRDAGSTQSRFAAQNANLQRGMSTAQQELTETDARRRVVITAPEDGRATLVSAELGQTVDPARPLMQLVPLNSNLQARLFAPSATIGFVRPGDKVLIRYQAYPYQKFGLHEGVVAAVSTAALPSAELAGFVLPEVPTGEPVYGITVNLQSQTVQTFGQPQALQAGLRLDADILQETRKLYEWMLEPLYSITGKMGH